MNRQSRTENYVKKIEYCFFHEAEIRMAVTEQRSRRSYHEIKNQSALSDPTASSAIRNLTPIDHVVIDSKELEKPETWLEVIHKSYAWSKEIENCYEVAAGHYSGEHFVKTCTRLEIGTDVYYRLLNKFRNRASVIAAWHRLISV